MSTIIFNRILNSVLTLFSGEKAYTMRGWKTFVSKEKRAFREHVFRGLPVTLNRECVILNLQESLFYLINC